MKKADSRALASAALSAFLVTGCENFATKDELAQVQSELAQASLELQEADQNLQQVQSELDAAELEIKELQKPSMASATHFREVVFDFDNLDPVLPKPTDEEYATFDPKNDPRQKFVAELEKMSKNIASEVAGFTGTFEKVPESEVLGTKDKIEYVEKVQYVLRNRGEGFVSHSERLAVEEVIKQKSKLVGYALKPLELNEDEAALPLRLDSGPSERLVLHNATNRYNSVAGTGKADIKPKPETLECRAKFEVTLESLAKKRAKGYVAQKNQAGTYVLSEVTGDVILFDFDGKVNEKGECKPVGETARIAYVMALLDNPKVAEYHKVHYVPENEDYDITPETDKFTLGKPACPPSEWPKVFETVVGDCV